MPVTVLSRLRGPDPASVKLHFQDQRYLDAAQGWLELANWHEANEELEQISPQMRAPPAVLLLRCQIYSKAKKWDYVVAVAQTLVKVKPAEPRAWLSRSFALRKLNRAQEAFDLLLPVAEKFSREWAVPYNLSCYCAKLGRFDESREWFKKALAIDEKSVRLTGTYDPDLKPLWDSMRGTLWKRNE